MREVHRFQIEKTIELRRVFAQYARLQVRSTAEMNEVLLVSAKPLEQSLTAEELGERLGASVRELEDAIRKMDVRHPAAETAERDYADVSL
ncbi:hypothetical protein PINS_up019172 [Pythium insidiosum]|nr:hypothetical protein PINS_up019172 [Pythium insidiosum]